MTPWPECRPRAAGLLAGLALAAVPGTVRAAPPDERVDMTSVDIESLLDLSVQAVTRRSERASEAPAVVFVLTDDDIRRQGFRTVAEVLDSVPGLYSFRSYFRQVGVRGMGFASDFSVRLLVLVDGHPINNNSLGVDIGRGIPVPLEAVRRVEVIKGPVGAVYGPYAFLGVVNLVTAGGVPGGGVWAGLEAGQGAVRTGEAAAAWRGRAGGVDALVAADVFRTRGFDYRFPELAQMPGAPADAVARGMDAAHAESGYLRASRGGVTASATCGRARTGLVGFLPTSARSAIETLTCFGDVGWQLRPASELAISLRLAGDDFEAQVGRVLPDPPIAVGTFVDEGHDRWMTAEARVDWSLARWLRLDAGATGKAHEVWHASRASAVPSLDAAVTRHFTELNGWGSVEAKVSRTLALHGGVTWYTHSLFGSQVTPRAAAVWQPSRDDTAKAVWSQGFRPPTIAEAIFSDSLAFLPNPELRPEKVISGELAYERRFAGFASVGAAAFWDRYHRLIFQETVPAPGLAGPPASPADYRQIPRNAPGHVDLVGGELVLTLRRGSAFQAYGGVSVQHLEGGTRTDFPALIGNLAVSWRWPWRPLLLAARGSVLGARSGAPPVNGVRYRAPACWTLSAFAALDVPGVPGLALEVGAVNLLDAENASPAPPAAPQTPRFPDAPRTVRADLRWTF